MRPFPRIRVRPQRGLRIVRSRLPPEDLHPSARLPRTTPLRTAFDLARRTDRFTTIPAIDAMLAADLVTKADVAALAKARKGWRPRRGRRNAPRV